MVATPIPITPAERVETLDILRGLALFGVMAINLVWGFRVSLFDRYYPGRSLGSALDIAVDIFLGVFVAGKALAIFALLFGVGLGVLGERLSRTDRAVVLLVRRLTVLFAIGLIHLLLIWNGDILTEYAAAGFVALPFLFGSRRLLAGAAIAFLVASLLVAVFVPLPLPDATWMTQHLMEADRVHRTGGFIEVTALQWSELHPIALWHLYTFPRTISLFLLGALIWRLRIPQEPIANRRLLKAVAWIGIPVGVVSILTATVLVALSGGQSAMANLLQDSSQVTLALGYSALVVIIATGRFGKCLAWAAPLGRMAFTNYLGQSVIFALVFFGYGLGMFNRVSTTAALAFGIAVYALQVVASTCWLRHYRFGPMEWLWRSATYGAWQPWRVAPGIIPQPSAPPPADRS